MKKIVFTLFALLSVCGLVVLVGAQTGAPSQQSIFCGDPHDWSCCFDGDNFIGCCQWETPIISYRIDERGNYARMGCFRTPEDCERANIGRCTYCDECP
jgi:hypothetical protein